MSFHITYMYLHRKDKSTIVSTLCEWLLKAWNNISCYRIVCGFKTVCMSNNFDGSEAIVLWEAVGNFVSVLSDDDSVEKEKEADLKEQLIILNKVVRCKLKYLC
jgi:hypothetical protein